MHEKYFDILSRLCPGEVYMKERIPNDTIQKRYQYIWMLLIKKVQEYISHDASILERNNTVLKDFFGNEIQNVGREDDLVTFKDVEVLDGMQDKLNSDVPDIVYHKLTENIYDLISQHKFDEKSRYKFEELIYKFESSKGPGLLMDDKDFIQELMLQYHEVVLLDDYNANIGRIKKAHKYLHEVKDVHINAFNSLIQLQLHVAVEFPRLLYYDTNQTIDLKRLKTYYQNLITRTKDRIVYYFKVLGRLGELFSRQEIKLHEEYNSSVLNSYIKFIQGIRDYLHYIRTTPGDYIKKMFKQNTETYKNKPVIEGFIGKLVKQVLNLFTIIGTLFEALIMIVQTITNPVQIIKLLITLMGVVFMLVLAIIDGINFVITAVLATLGMVVYVLIKTIAIYYFLIYVYLGALFELYFKGGLSRFFYEWFTATEKDIRNWYNVPSYETGNDVARPFLWPTHPCSEGYKPGLLWCERIPDYIPRYSYHANIYRSTKGKKVSGNTAVTSFATDSKFRDLPNSLQLRELNKYAKRCNTYHTVMRKKMKAYTLITKTTCNSIDTLDVADSVKKQIKIMCLQNYCRNGMYETFCPTFGKLDTYTYSKDLIETYIHLTSYILMITCVCAMLYIGYFYESKDIAEIGENLTNEVVTTNTNTTPS
jgi:hypothetical protein